MNAVIIAVFVMLILSLMRVQVVLALAIGAFTGGIVGGLGISETITVFTEGLGNNAVIALSYALLGAFALGISKTGLPEVLVSGALKVTQKQGDSKKKALSKALLLLIIVTISIFSQNLIPIHIAFIPILIPPLLMIFNELKMDRRALASSITFGLTAPYILLPVGFGLIFHQIIQEEMEKSGLNVDMAMIPKAMSLPVIGMVIGLLIALFVSYRKPRRYENKDIASESERITAAFSVRSITVAIIAIVATVVIQILTESMIMGALTGIIILLFSGSFSIRESDVIFTDGMKMMAFIGFVMITAAGFAEVMRETGHIEQLVESASAVFAGNQVLAALIMLLVGLLVTMGIGSSFATIPIIATIFVPFAQELGFSPLAIVALVGTAGALGDAGSPASDSTLGPTAGLNADGQHNHIWDTCVPTFLHYNIPLVLFGWIAAIIF
ncbi:Na+/H+ antiporter family protein [Pseudalkalibacillus salsuginis]|uniref:Na+/H+ antiporter family protein n=1 Tax=Pseudalkalibacillus salsuginis TaxID=2910972 RepID=UPI001F27BD23|nr:Na+/H+ antiporter family protein [Pseudalkalibacillus salsuginis]MCF6409041.1 Na+/H+ antiporter family protein [Pseudalkalibacillus salsuginis]